MRHRARTPAAIGARIGYRSAGRAGGSATGAFDAHGVVRPQFRVEGLVRFFGAGMLEIALDRGAHFVQCCGPSAVSPGESHEVQAEPGTHRALPAALRQFPQRRLELGAEGPGSTS